MEVHCPKPISKHLLQKKTVIHKKRVKWDNFQFFRIFYARLISFLGIQIDVYSFLNISFFCDMKFLATLYSARFPFHKTVLYNIFISYFEICLHRKFNILILRRTDLDLHVIQCVLLHMLENDFFFQNFVENKTLTVYITSAPLVTMKRKTSNDDRFLKELMRGQIQVSYIIDNYGILYDY